MNSIFNIGENLTFRGFGDLLMYVDSPQEEISKDATRQLKDMFNKVSDRWLMHGLINYFNTTKSKRVLDLLLAAPCDRNCHDKYLFDKISDGLRGGDQFSSSSLLLYAVSRNPSPQWIYKISSHSVIKDVIAGTANTRDDINILVNNVMILVVLLPKIPLQLAKHLKPILNSFWSLVNWVPNRNQDITLKPYLQSAVFSLFHRLYALYPCNLLSFLRSVTCGHSKKAWFVSTLKPMLEMVRLHPLLVSETKETEISRGRWMGMEYSDIINENAKLCLDPLQEMGEDISTTPCHSCIENSGEDILTKSDGYVLCSSETSFWSPCTVQSPSSANNSVPHTPVYGVKKIHLSSRGSLLDADIIPEPAIEATPETTPYSSPIIFDDNVALSHSASAKWYVKMDTDYSSNLDTTSESAKDSHSSFVCSSSSNKKTLLKFSGENESDKLGKTDTSHLFQNRLKEIRKERVDIKLKSTTNIIENDKEIKEADSPTKDIVYDDTSANTNLPRKNEIRRERKRVVYDRKLVEELFSEKYDNDNSSIHDERRPSTEDTECNLSRKNSNDSQSSEKDDECLGVASQQSMNDLVKNVRTMRLGFLSTCGPPPNISPLSSKSSGEDKMISKDFQKSRNRSLPNLTDENLYNLTLKCKSFKVSNISPSSIVASPMRSSNPVELSDCCTQTEDIPVLNPHENLIEVLRETEPKSKVGIVENASPYEFLDKFLNHLCMGTTPPSHELGWTYLSEASYRDSRQHLHAMHTVMMMERYKRGVHCERNRRLLGRMQKMEMFRQRDYSYKNQVLFLKEEVKLAKENENRLKEMDNINKKNYEVIGGEDKASTISKNSIIGQREKLRSRAFLLSEQKQELNGKLEEIYKAFIEAQRVIDIHSKSTHENCILKDHVSILEKRLIVMGEVQFDMNQRMVSQREARIKSEDGIAHRNFELIRNMLQEQEAAHRAEVENLKIANYRIHELEKVVKLQNKTIGSHSKKMNNESSYWKERCCNLEKRNNELQSINFILESNNVTIKNRENSTNSTQLDVWNDHSYSIASSPAPDSFLASQMRPFVPLPYDSD